MRLDDCKFAYETVGLVIQALKDHNLDVDETFMAGFQDKLIEKLTQVQGTLLREKSILVKRQERCLGDGMSRHKGIVPGMVRGVKVDWTT